MSHHHHHVDQHQANLAAQTQHLTQHKTSVELSPTTTTPSLSEKTEETIDTTRPSKVPSLISYSPKGRTMAVELGAKRNQKLCCGLVMHKNDLRLIQMIILFSCLICFGGLIFWAIEEPAELARVAEAKLNHALAKEKVLSLLNHNQTLFNLLKQADAEEAFNTHLEYTDNWTFASAALFSFTVITTIGYGVFAPTTAGGRIFLVVYAMIGIPAAGITLVFVAERALKCVTSFFTMFDKDKVHKAYKQFDQSDTGFLDLDEFRDAIKSLGITLTDLQYSELVVEIDLDGNGEIDSEEFAVAVEKLNADVTEAAGRSHRIKIVLLALLIWMSFGCVVLCYAEGWTADEGIYFSFVTLTTVGLGDFFPKSTWGQIFLVVYAAVGLGELAVLLSLIEGLLGDWDKARKIAIEKARASVIAAREAAIAAKNDIRSRTVSGRTVSDAANKFKAVGSSVMTMGGRTVSDAANTFKAVGSSVQAKMKFMKFSNKKKKEEQDETYSKEEEIDSGTEQEQEKKRTRSNIQQGRRKLGYKDKVGQTEVMNPLDQIP